MTPERWQQIRDLLEKVLEPRARFYFARCASRVVASPHLEARIRPGRHSWMQAATALDYAHGTNRGDRVT